MTKTRRPILHAITLGLLAIALARDAGAHNYPDNFGSGELFVSARWDTNGVDWAPGLRVTAMHLRAFMPVGGSLDLQWFVKSSVARVGLSATLVPTKTLSGSACERTRTVDRRNETLALKPSFAVGLGPLLEWANGGPMFGVSASGYGTFAFATSHLRLDLTSRGGVGTEIGAGLRLPSIMGFDDVLATCP